LDPIGVKDGKNDRDDEYDSYVTHIFRLAIKGKDASSITSSLIIIKSSHGIKPK
jgi:hypothetical protein